MQEIEHLSKHNKLLIDGKWYTWQGWAIDKDTAERDKIMLMNEKRRDVKVIKSSKDGYDIYLLDDRIIYSK
jgi:hypothetical protein